MAWNIPGSNNNKDDKDPWTGKAKKTTPPDLEQALRELRKKLQHLVNTKRALKPNIPAVTPPFKFNKYTLGMTLGLCLGLWFAWGVYSVGPGEQAIVVRLGKYTTTQGPGLHWVPRIFEHALVVNQQRSFDVTYNSRVLTQDQNLVDVSLTVRYRIKDARAYLFNVANPGEMLLRAIISATNQVLGSYKLEQALLPTRQQLLQQLQTTLARALAPCELGIEINTVVIASIKAPAETQEAFTAASRAFEATQQTTAAAVIESQRIKLGAQEQAQRLEADAKAYQQATVLHAKADTAQFLALVPSYRTAPAVMRSRLYLETLEQVLSNNHKIVIDANAGGNNLLYLPLDKLMSSITVSNLPAPVLTTPTNSSALPLTLPASNTVSTNHSDFSDIGPVQGGYSQ